MAHNVFFEEMSYTGETIPFKAVTKRYKAEPTFFAANTADRSGRESHSKLILPTDSEINNTISAKDYQNLRSQHFDLPNRLQYHVHDYIQITQKHSGSIVYIFLGDVLQIEDSDILFIHSNTPHCWLAQENTYCTSAAFYENSLCFDSGLIRFQPYLKFFSFHIVPYLLIKESNPYHSRIKLALDNLIEINEKQGYGFDAILRNQAVILLLLILQMLIDTQHPSMNFVEDPTLQHALSHMIMNYSENISVKDIAEHVGMNADYFSHFFKQKMGMSCKKFLNRLRIEKAASLLMSSNLSITEILYECGYKTMSVFYRAFNEMYSMSPTNYRKMHLSVLDNALNKSLE